MLPPDPLTATFILAFVRAASAFPGANLLRDGFGMIALSIQRPSSHYRFLASFSKPGPKNKELILVQKANSAEKEYELICVIVNFKGLAAGPERSEKAGVPGVQSCSAGYSRQPLVEAFGVDRYP